MGTDAFCEACGGIMARMSWNNDTDVLVCENPECTAFRAPVVPVETKIKSMDKSAKKANILWLRGEDEDEEDRQIQATLLSLQRLRETFHS